MANVVAILWIFDYLDKCNTLTCIQTLCQYFNNNVNVLSRVLLLKISTKVMIWDSATSNHSSQTCILCFIQCLVSVRSERESGLPLPGRDLAQEDPRGNWNLSPTVHHRRYSVVKHHGRVQTLWWVIDVEYTKESLFCYICWSNFILILLIVIRFSQNWM